MLPIFLAVVGYDVDTNEADIKVLPYSENSTGDELENVNRAWVASEQLAGSEK